ncbi:unnamed protein product, partial [Notodromas monacha]
MVTEEGDSCPCGEQRSDGVFMVQCDSCGRWYHGMCCDLPEYRAHLIDMFVCRKCTTGHKEILNQHRHDPTDPSGNSKPVQCGTSDFLEELSSRDLYDAELVIVRLRAQQFNLLYVCQNGLDKPVLVAEKDGLDLKMPGGKFGSPKDVEKLVGSDKVVDVIDSTRQTSIRMTLRELVKYYESPRKGAILNCISLEVSETKLGNLVDSPYLVRKLSWDDTIWPEEKERETGCDVQKYCLISAKDSYTDFHIDFGGSTVWYHIFKGEKVFYLVRPTKANLAAYKKWLGSANQLETFFGDLADVCYKLKVKQGSTLFIPSGWIHAVWTPVDSIVFGGNFLHNHSISTQLQIYEMEKRASTPPKLCYPYLETLHWVAAIHMLKDFEDWKKDNKVTGVRKKRADAVMPVPPFYMMRGLKALSNALKSWANASCYKSSTSARREPIPISEPNKLVKDLAKEVKFLEKELGEIALEDESPSPMPANPTVSAKPVPAKDASPKPTQTTKAKRSNQRVAASQAAARAPKSETAKSKKAEPEKQKKSVPSKEKTKGEIPSEKRDSPVVKAETEAQPPARGSQRIRGRAPARYRSESPVQPAPRKGLKRTMKKTVEEAPPVKLPRWTPKKTRGALKDAVKPDPMTQFDFEDESNEGEIESNQVLKKPPTKKPSPQKNSAEKAKPRGKNRKKLVETEPVKSEEESVDLETKPEVAPEDLNKDVPGDSDVFGMFSQVANTFRKVEPLKLSIKHDPSKSESAKSTVIIAAEKVINDYLNKIKPVKKRKSPATKRETHENIDEGNLVVKISKKTAKNPPKNQETKKPRKAVVQTGSKKKTPAERRKPGTEKTPVRKPARSKAKKAVEAAPVVVAKKSSADGEKEVEEEEVLNGLVIDEHAVVTDPVKSPVPETFKLKFSLGKRGGISVATSPVHGTGSPDRLESTWDHTSSSGIDQLLKASVLDAEDKRIAQEVVESGRASPSTRDAIAGMLSIGRVNPFPGLTSSSGTPPWQSPLSSAMSSRLAGNSPMYGSESPVHVSSPVHTGCGSLMASSSLANPLSMSTGLSSTKQNVKKHRPLEPYHIVDTKDDDQGSDGEPVKEVHQDDDFVYTPLNDSDDELGTDGTKRKLGGGSKKPEDSAWSPRARVVSGPKPERPHREGTQRTWAEKGLQEARKSSVPTTSSSSAGPSWASPEGAGRSSSPDPSDPTSPLHMTAAFLLNSPALLGGNVKKDTKLGFRSFPAPKSSPSSSSSSDAFKRRPKKGMATAKQSFLLIKDVLQHHATRSMLLTSLSDPGDDELSTPTSSCRLSDASICFVVRRKTPMKRDKPRQPRVTGGGSLAAFGANRVSSALALLQLGC